LQDILERTSSDVKMLVKHIQMVQTQIDQLTKVQKDLLVNASREKHDCEISTRSGASTQDPLYPEGHPKRIEQDSQCAAGNGTLSRKKKKKHKTVVESSEIGKDPNSVSISDVETKSGNASDKEEFEENQKSLLRMQSTPRKISLPVNMVVREPWVQKPMPFPGKKHKSRKNTITGFVNG
jgi:hypothetical protein